MKTVLNTYRDKNYDGTLYNGINVTYTRTLRRITHVTYMYTMDMYTMGILQPINIHEHVITFFPDKCEKDTIRFHELIENLEDTLVAWLSAMIRLSAF